MQFFATIQYREKSYPRREQVGKFLVKPSELGDCKFIATYTDSGDNNRNNRRVR